MDKINAISKAATKAGVRVVINARTDVFLRDLGAPESRLGVASSAAGRFSPPAPTACSCPASRSRHHLARSSRHRRPVNILAVKGTPPIPELEALGVARVSLGSGPMRAALALVRDIARELKAHRTYGTFTAHAMAFDEVNELMK